MNSDPPPPDDRRRATTQRIIARHYDDNLEAEAGFFQTKGGIAAFLFHTSLPEEHPFYSLIGRVAAEAAQVEHTLDLIIWELSGVKHELGSCITGQLAGAYGRFNAIQALASAKGANRALLNEIETLSNKTNSTLKLRHRFVHDAWFTTGGDHAGQFKSIVPKDAKFGIHDVSDTEANNAIKEIKKRRTEIGKLRDKLQKL